MPLKDCMKKQSFKFNLKIDIKIKKSKQSSKYCLYKLEKIVTFLMNFFFVILYIESYHVFYNMKKEGDISTIGNLVQLPYIALNTSTKFSKEQQYF